MAIITTSKGRTVRLVYTGDDSVKLSQDARAKRVAAALDKAIRAAVAAIPDDAASDAATLAAARADATARFDASLTPLAWVPESECTSSDGATVATIRGLSWLEDQEARALEPNASILRTIELGLVALDGDAEKARAFCADPAARLMVPLYHAIAELTWGNF